MYYRKELCALESFSNQNNLIKMSKVFVLLLLVLVAATSARPSSTEEEKRLIEVSATEPAKWLSQEEIQTLIQNKIHFMDITGRNYPTVTRDVSNPKAFPVALRFNSTVRGMFDRIDIPWMTDFVAYFSSSRNRHYDSPLGAQSSIWLYNLISDGIASSGYRGNVTVRRVSHNWQQNSIVARIEGNGNESGVIILGAHQDSINSQHPDYDLAPGADDNASGSVAVLETLLILLESGFVPKKSIEFHWYAAEEVGLRGSQDIAESYLAQNVDVVSMLNFDVIGYAEGNNRIGFRTDANFTDTDLTQFLRVVFDEYLDFDRITGECGYACSDHASWARFGYPAAFIKEAEPFLDMHTDRDTIDKIDFVQVKEFVKLALGYIIELAEPAT